jgi:hypothetical protein
VTEPREFPEFRARKATRVTKAIPERKAIPDQQVLLELSLMETIQYQSKALLARKEIRETKVNPAFLEFRVSGVLVAVTELTEQMDRPALKVNPAFKVNREFRVSLELMAVRVSKEFPEKSER